jgi:type IV pilus assembly protein PilW
MEFAERHNRGFTLLEILITLAIVSILIVFVSKTFLIHRKTYDVQGQVTDMVQRARGSLDLMIREVRMAGYNPTRAPFPGIVYNDSFLVAMADLNGDGDASDPEEGIIYYYDSGNARLNRATSGSNDILADHIQEFKFVHLKADGSVTTNTADIRQIEVLITARTEKPDADYAANSGYRTYSLTSLITPKNLDL